MAGFLILFFVIFLFTVAMHRQTLDEHTRLINAAQSAAPRS